MEQQFKNRILEYLVGDYQIETQPDNSPDILDTNSTLVDLRQILQENSLFITGTLISQNNLIVLYGGKVRGSGNGFIMITDMDYNVIELFTTYEGGTTLPLISYMIQEENGDFFALSTPNSGGTYTGKILMLNNFTLTLTDDYKLKYRQSYNFSQDLLNVLNSQGFVSNEWQIIKKQAEAKYLIVSFTYRGGNGLYYHNLDMATVQINAGSDNEWTFSSITNYPAQVQNNVYCEWNGDDYRIKIGYNFMETTTNEYYEQKIINGVGGTVKKYSYEALRNPLIYDIVMPNFNTTYVSAVRNGNYVFQIYNDEISLIFGDDGTANDYIELYSYNNMVLGRAALSSGTSSQFYFITLNNAYEMNTAPVPNNYYFIMSQNTFNLYEFMLAPLDFAFATQQVNVYTIRFICNLANYNGDDYQALNSMIPHSGVLYDENNKAIFARNIYNKIINQNTTESTIEIPNTNLNDTTIEKQNLISETNSLLNTNTQSISKNIYESVYINFFNTINMKDANVPNNVIINVPGASRLNGSISGQNSYNNVKIGLVKVNYTDNTSQNITGLEITKNSDTNYTISFVIYVPKEISSIQIMSSDGMTTYQTINPNLQTGKFYRITQDVKIV